MNRILQIILVISLCGTSTAFGQEWSDEQQEVIDQAELGAEKWYQAVFEQKDYSKWGERYADKDFNFWFFDNGVPLNQASDIERVKTFQKQVKNAYFQHWYPLEVKIYGDIAFLYFYSYEVNENLDGAITTLEIKRLHAYKKEGDTWILIEGAAAIY